MTVRFAYSSTPNARSDVDGGTLPVSLGPNKPLKPSGNEMPATWWRPGWGDVVAAAGWSWILLVIAAAGLGLGAAILLVVTGFAFTGLLFKPIILLIGGAMVLVGYAVRKAIHARREPFCIFCGYCLTGLPEEYDCPECGRPYTRRQIDEYRKDPQWFIERWKARQQLPPADPPVDTGPPRPRRRSRDGTE
jgi:hypothetical protein